MNSVPTGGANFLEEILSGGGGAPSREERRPPEEKSVPFAGGEETARPKEKAVNTEPSGGASFLEGILTNEEKVPFQENGIPAQTKKPQPKEGVVSTEPTGGASFLEGILAGEGGRTSLGGGGIPSTGGEKAPSREETVGNRATGTTGSDFLGGILAGGGEIPL